MVVMVVNGDGWGGDVDGDRSTTDKDRQNISKTGFQELCSSTLVNTIRTVIIPSLSNIAIIR